MRHATGIGRLGGLALGLGIGAALAAIPGTASADPSSPQLPDLVTADMSPLLIGDAAALAADPSAALEPGSAAPSLFNIAISFGGTSLLQLGSATATSSTGTFAIAIGANSDANANAFGDTNDYAFAVGDNSFAQANDGTGDWAIALLDGTAKTGGGANDFAFAAGDNSLAEAGGFGGTPGNDDTALALGTGTQGYAGTFPGFAVGNNDEADVFGDGSIGIAGDNGNGDTAAIFGDASTADAGFGASDISLNNDDLAAVVGDALTATATTGSGLTDFVP